MSIFTRDKVFLSADKATYLQYDKGTGQLNIVVGGTTVGYMTTSGIVWNLGVTEVLDHTFQGDTTIGNAITDSLTVTARLISDLMPLADNVRDLGSAALRYAEIHGTIIAGDSFQVRAGGEIEVDDGTATASSSAATLSKMAGKITTESLTTAAQAAETLTITNTLVAATDIIIGSVANGDNSQGVPVVGRITAGAGSFTVTLENQHASQALNGTLVFSFVVLKTS